MRGAIAILLVLGIGGYALYRLVSSGREDTGPLIVRLVLSAILIAVLYTCLGMGPFAWMAFAPGVLLGLVWAPVVGDLFADGMLGIISGPKERSDDRPYYSEAEGKRARGDLAGALGAIDEQLRKFPGDFEGQMLLATIQVENQRNVHAAQVTVENILSQPQRTAGQIAQALNQLADWLLQYSHDRDAAMATLKRVEDRLPGTSQAMRTSQRRARMEATFEVNDPRDVGSLVSDCLKHLERHPLDNHTREVLARIYFQRYQRPDLAVAELDRLVNTPHQLREDISRWLHLAADWHMTLGNRISAQLCLENLLRRYPESAVAERAEQRLLMLKDSPA